MKDKTAVEHCGKILNKSATGDEYKWGLRFYILLIECLRGWAEYNDDPDFISKYKRLKETVPIHDEEIYYYQNVEINGIDHRKVDELLTNTSEFIKSPDYFKSSEFKKKSVNDINMNSLQNKSEIENPDLKELKSYKQAYLNAVFNKNADINSIYEETIKYQSYYDSIKTKIIPGKIDLDTKNEFHCIF